MGFASNHAVTRKALVTQFLEIAIEKVFHVKHWSTEIKPYKRRSGAIRIFFLPRHDFKLHIWKLLRELNKVKVVLNRILGVSLVLIALNDEVDLVKHKSIYPKLFTFFAQCCMFLHKCSRNRLKWFKTT